MSGIAGCTRPGSRNVVALMLDRIAHRGPAGRAIIENDAGTLGVVWTKPQATAEHALHQEHIAQDNTSAGRLAQAAITPQGLVLERDVLGVAPLYYAQTADGALCFASEVKALLVVCRDIKELLPGQQLQNAHTHAHSELVQHPPSPESPQYIAQELRGLLTAAVQENLGHDEVGCWLSGGLDSSTMAALARPHVSRLRTFVAGLAGAPDLEYARCVADFIGADHHEVIVSLEEMLAVLPAVIYHLESFDALLVRSSIVNYLVAKAAAGYVPAVFSGEGGDELLAGYAYLKQLDQAVLADELLEITRRLHNTALQRVDRCSSAHGLVAHVGFLAPAVVDYALRIPVELKLREGVEKWILRQAMDGLLPASVLQRTKAKFWDGAGVGDLLAYYADAHVTDADFERERKLENSLLIHTKEELMYYRIFREHFGEFADLSWMGRTKGAPKA